MAVVTFPRLNPIIFTKEIIPYFENYTSPFIQKFNTEDYIIFQVFYDNDFYPGEVIAKLIDCNDNEVADFTQDVINVGNNYQGILRCSCNVESGLYRVLLTTVSSKFNIYSNCLDIGNHENTLLIQYACRENKFDSIFITETYAYYYILRMIGGVKSADVEYKSDDVIFTDQRHKVVLIDSIPYSIRKYTFGDSSGIANWMADKINRIMSCDSVLIDGIKVVKDEGAAIEKITSNAYPFLGININLLYPEEGDSEILYDGNNAYMQSGIQINMVDNKQNYSVSPEKNGRIHVNEFVNIFN